MNKRHVDKICYKRFVVFLLAISIFTLCFTSGSTTSAASKIDTSKPVELQWYVVGNGDQVDIDIVTDEINKYLKSKINATLKLKTLTWGDDFEIKMARKIASREPFDITFTSSWALYYQENAKKGAFVDITKMIDTYAPKTKALIGNNMIKGAKVNGKLYGIPTYNYSNFNCYGLLLNNDLVKKYKVDTKKIKKLSDLEPILKTIKAKEPKVIGFFPFNNYGTYSIYNSLGYEKLVSDKVPGAIKGAGKSTKIINDFASAETKALFNLMRKWNKSGYINKAIPEYSDEREEYFENNASNIFAFCEIIHPMKAQDMYFSYDIDTIPVELSKPTMTTRDVTGSMQAISRTSKNPERALMFLELVNTDEKLSNLINYGIEGVHYNKIDSKSISLIEPRFADYNPSSKWLYGNESIAYSLAAEDPTLWNDVKAMRNRAVTSPLLGFSFNSTPVSSQISKMPPIVDKYLDKLSLGKVDPSSTLTKMNKELTNAGMQKVLNEMQKQVNAFLKAKK